MKLFFVILLLLTLIGPVWMIFSGHADLGSDYRTADRSSAHLAPNPETEKNAVIQVYSARAFNWRGALSTHCWISTKTKDAKNYTVYQVVGWRTFRGLPALGIEHDIPDRIWYNQKPRVILDIRGSEAEKLIPKIDEAAKSYPYAVPYVLWPGPNSNTFPAYVARQVPELGLALPSDAIGKDFLPGWNMYAKAPSGTGYQISLKGLLGVLVARKEGIEINILGLVYGIKFAPFSILLPGIGQL